MSKSTTDNEELFNKAAYILHGSANPPVPDKVDERRVIWADIQNNESPDDYTWTEEDELDLKKKQEQVESLTINDTDYGRTKELRKHETKATFATMSRDEKFSLFYSLTDEEKKEMFAKWDGDK